jgi:hypothetical protein
MSIRDELTGVLRGPTPAALWRLRAELLEAGIPPEAPVWRVMDEFRHYLDQLATSTSSRDYSDLASRLDISAVGGVVLEHALESEKAEDLALRLFTGLLSEGLMVLATRQHVKAWQGELSAVCRNAAWYLYDELWRWAEARKPDLPPHERRLLLDRLLAPLCSSDGAGSSGPVLAGLLFQVLLLSHLAEQIAKAPGQGSS